MRKRFTLILIIAIFLIGQTFYFAYAGEARPITKILTINFRVLPKTEIKIDENKIQKNWQSLDQEEIAKALNSNDENLIVDKVTRNGKEMIRVTKILGEALY